MYDLINILQNLTYKELIDLLIVFTFFYILIRIFIEAKLVYLISGLILLAVFYFFSVFLELKTVNLIFTNFFNIFWLVIVVVFQKEIRKLFETLGHFLNFNKKQKLKNIFLKEILESLDSLSKQKIGAIFVFRGKESLDPYIQNGFSLNGEISKPLILSILDPHSPGHDGAIIIEENKIKKFGAFLPLSENTNLPSNLGTRHRAGVGITEVIDALCIVVSEEKGKISIIKNGNIKEIEELSDVKKEIENFYESIWFKLSRKNKLQLAKKNILVAVLSIICTLSIFILINYKNPTIQKSFIVPIEFKNIPQNFYVENLNDNSVFISLSGKEKDFNFIDEKKLKITIDVSNVREGTNKILIKREFINIPQFLNIIKIDPEYVKIKLIKIPTSTPENFNQ